MNKRDHMSRHLKKCLLGIIILCFAVRVIALLMLQAWEFEGNGRYGSRAGEIGSALASGEGFSWAEKSSFVVDGASKRTSWEAPVYPLIFAGTFKVFGIYSTTSAVLLILFQIILSALACVIVFLVASRTFSVWTGLIGALIFALYPASIHFSVEKIQCTILIVLLLLLFVYQLLGLATSPSIWKSILGGITFGVGLLTDPTILAFFPFALAWLLVKGRGKLRTQMIHVGVILLAVCFVNLPWQIRNYAVFGESFLIKSNLSRELFMGNYRNNVSFDEEKRYMATMDEGKRNRLYTRMASESIIDAPDILVRKSFKRFVIYWTALTSKDIRKRSKINILDKVVGLCYLVILVLGISGLGLTLSKHQKAQLLILALISLPIPYYLTWFTRFRYRFPVETIMIIFASYAMFCLLAFLKKKTS